MALKCTLPASYDPVNLGEAQNHCIAPHDEDSGLLYRMIGAATKLVEAQTSRQFIPATWTFYADCFEPEILLRVCPVQSIEAVRYVDPAGATQTLSPSAYQLDAVSEPARLVPAYGYTWPQTREQINSVEVEFIAGYADGASVPDHAKHAILLLVGHWYENREAVLTGTVSKEIELSFKTLIASLLWSAV